MRLLRRPLARLLTAPDDRSRAPDGLAGPRTRRHLNTLPPGASAAVMARLREVRSAPAAGSGDRAVSGPPDAGDPQTGTELLDLIGRVAELLTPGD